MSARDGGPTRKTRRQLEAEFLKEFAELAEEAGMNEVADELRENASAMLAAREEPK